MSVVSDREQEFLHLPLVGEFR